jgi:hypothetical protein
MQPILQSVPVLAVSVIYCLLGAYWRERRRRADHLRQRVAYMLWVIAQQGP